MAISECLLRSALGIGRSRNTHVLDVTKNESSQNKAEDQPGNLSFLISQMFKTRKQEIKHQAPKETSYRYTTNDHRNLFTELTTKKNGK